MKHTSPRERAATYVARQPSYEGVNGREINEALRNAWLAGYRAAARARRIVRPVVRKRIEGLLTEAERAMIDAQFDTPTED